jgi:AraC family transcriptional regulator, regulatory protein of adaptative response / methylated-DNA-[protein]-cysteine methyltransferase
MRDYQRIATAIAYLNAHVREQPSLVDIAAQVHLSPFHFQRLFTRWAGTTPKRFLQVLTLELGKHLLQEQASLLTVADAAGLSSASRLHEHFVQLEAVTPGEYRARGQGLGIRYGLGDSPFGTVFVARTARGICRVTFLEDEYPASLNEAVADLQASWPLAHLSADPDAAADVAGLLAGKLPVNGKPLSLHIKGTNFQLAVWRALLRIPPGRATTYAEVAAAAGKPTAVRATGTAIGANPAAFLIPCHRVIRQSGALGGYRWGLVRKQALQAWERLRQEPLPAAESRG